MKTVPQFSSSSLLDNALRKFRQSLTNLKNQVPEINIWLSQTTPSNIDRGSVCRVIEVN